MPGSVPRMWPSHLHGGARTEWWGKKGWEPACLAGSTEGRSLFPSALVCVAVPVGDAESREGLAVVTPCAETRVRRAVTLATTKPEWAQAVPGSLGGTLSSAAGHEGLDPLCLCLCPCPCWSTAAVVAFCCSGTGLASAATFLPLPAAAQEHKTISLGSVPVSSLNEL